jgi:pimeloyl-ACP methyl ester carboxylesterase
MGNSLISQQFLGNVMYSEMIKNATNNLPISVRMLMILTSGPEHLQGVPEHLNYSEFSSIPLNSYKEYFGMSKAWTSTNWSGVCDKLTKVSSPTLIITGTDDKNMPPANSLISRLVHIKDASHALMIQYPDKFNQVLQTFLSTTTNPG